MKLCSMQFIRRISLLMAMVFLSACTSMQVNQGRGIAIPCRSSIVVGPIANNSDTPLANKQVESMLIGLLHAKGFQRVSAYQTRGNCGKLLYCPDSMPSRSELVAYARQRGAQFILTGGANEWRYKVGLDGEPVAGASLQLISVRHGTVVWSAVGSAIGSTRQGLDVLGQNLLIKLTSNISAV